MEHHSTVMSPLYETDRHMPSTLRARKLSSTGGNRSWSEEEENYLLQTRQQKMPYKHIAAHLKKTELACRLHYHQLSHGSHRRKRTTSMSSHASSASRGQSPSMGQYVPAEHDEYAMAGSRQCSPLSYAGSQSPPQHSIHASPNRSSHKILLPKPRPLTPRDSPEPPRLRINTNESMMQSGAIDKNRLRAIYEARRAGFWASIAAEYGSDVSPVYLEEIWRGTSAVGARPPTPDASPDGNLSAYPHYPSLKPSPFAYPGPSAMEARKTYSPLHQISAVSAPDRMHFVLPQPTPSMGNLSRSSPWSSSSNVPIAALLTEDRNPRGQEGL